MWRVQRRERVASNRQERTASAECEQSTVEEESAAQRAAGTQREKAGTMEPRNLEGRESERRQQRDATKKRETESNNDERNNAKARARGGSRVRSETAEEAG